MLGRITKRSTMTGAIPLFAAAAVIVVFSFFVAFGVSAQADLGLADVGQASGLATGNLSIIIARIIRAFFGLLGIVLVAIFSYAGFLWMTAGGDMAKVDTAKRIIRNAIIGTVIMLCAYAIAEFVLRAIFGSATPRDFGPRSPSQLATLYGAHSGSHHLGGGIIEYHYPEVGQTGVPRNTKVAITLKKPIVLSTIIDGYDDNGTYTLVDDTVNGQPVVPGASYPLNTANIKVALNAALGTPGSGGANERFDQRYPDSALVQPAMTVTVTPTAEEFEPNERQTLVITFAAPIGSPSTDVNHRVALRGGLNGIRVWGADTNGNPVAENAFNELNPDGSYFWPFATSTLLDTTPPQVTATVPTAQANPSLRPLDRNQLLQVYFNEAVDPTTTSGITGAAEHGGRGFTLLNVEARCVPGAVGGCEERYAAGFAPVVGEWRLSNRYRTAEFVPAEACDGISMNSCGETVYCLPRNVELRVTMHAATIADAPQQQPAAITPPDGITDMVNNSLDGNRNGAGDGPAGPAYSLNNPQGGDSTGDTVLWTAVVGNTVDLIPPRVIDIIPKSFGEGSGAPSAGDPFIPPDQGGPSRVPITLQPTFVWSKTISVSSVRTGAFDENAGTFDSATPNSTVVFRGNECTRNDGADCGGGPNAQCLCTRLPSPAFTTDLSLEEHNGEQVSVLRLRTRPLFTGNDLGYTAAEIALYPDRTPTYQPVLRAQIRDTKQNCFFPSAGFDCAADSSHPSCCNRDPITGVYVCPM